MSDSKDKTQVTTDKQEKDRLKAARKYAYNRRVNSQIRSLITRYERKIKDAGKMAKDQTPTGFFQKGRKTAYENVVLDLMQIVQREK